MKVKELIELLSQLDPELMVVKSGYEGGVNEIKKYKLCDIELNVNTDWYYGKHEVLEKGDEPQNKDSTIVKGVRLIWLVTGVKNYMKNTKTYNFDFTPNNERQNYETLNLLIDKTFSGRGNVEKVEELFNITFASGMENGKPVYLNSTDIDDKYDGKVDLGIIPMDNVTKVPFTKSKLTFKIDVNYVNDEALFVKGIINSLIRNTLEVE